MLLVTATSSSIWMQTRFVLYDIEAPRSHLINTELAAEDQVSEGLSPQKGREDATRGARRVGPISSFPIYEIASSHSGGRRQPSFDVPRTLLEYLQRPAEPALDVG